MIKLKDDKLEVSENPKRLNYNHNDVLSLFFYTLQTCNIKPIKTMI